MLLAAVSLSRIAMKARPVGERAGLRFSHSTTQQAKARTSASCRGKLPSNSAMAARSSNKASQSSPDHPSLPVRSSAITSAL